MKIWKDPRNRDGIVCGTEQRGITAKLRGHCCLRAPDAPNQTAEEAEYR